jgi:hypothetical protein
VAVTAVSIRLTKLRVNGMGPVFLGTDGPFRGAPISGSKVVLSTRDS